MLARTYSGRAMFAIGGNEEAARLSGISVKRQQARHLRTVGLFAAVAGIVLAARLASAQPQAANGYELDAIAAVVIGGASLSGGAGSAFGTLIGALILAVLRNGLNLLSVSAFWQQVVIGARDRARGAAGHAARAGGSRCAAAYRAGAPLRRRS